MSAESIASAETNPKRPLIYKITATQNGDAMRRGISRAKIDKQQRRQRRELRLRRTALKVLRDKHSTDAERRQAREVLHEPWVRVSKWANRVARAEAREGKHEERLQKLLRKHEPVSA